MKSFAFLLLAAIFARSAPVFQACNERDGLLHIGSACTRGVDAQPKFNTSGRIVVRQDDDFFGDGSGFSDDAFDTGSDDSAFEADGFGESSPGPSFDANEGSRFDESDIGGPGPSNVDEASFDDGGQVDAADNFDEDLDGVDATGGRDTAEDDSSAADADDADSGVIDATGSSDSTSGDGGFSDIAGSSNGTDTTDTVDTTDGTDFGDDPGVSNSTDTSDTTSASEDSATDLGATNSTVNATPSQSKVSSQTATTPASADNSKGATGSTSSSTCAQSSTGPNAATVTVIKQFEGFESSPKPDPIKLPTVGFGHKCIKANCAEVPFAFPLSPATATSLLQTDAQKFVDCLHGFINKSVKLNENQFGALTSFTFNLGCGAVQSSTLVKRLNNGEDPNMVAAQEMPRFNKAGGKVFSGLVKRRDGEVALFQTPSTTVAHPLC